MASFKYKPERLKYLSNVNTLDEIHKKHANDFITQKHSLPEKKEIFNKTMKELTELENKGKDNYDINDIKQRAFLKDKLCKLEEDMFDIENGVSELDYYSKTNDILIEYYNIIDDNETDNNRIDTSSNITTVETTVTNTNGIQISSKLVELNLISQKKRKVKKQTRKRIRKLEQKPANNILAFFGSSEQSHNSDSPSDTVSETPQNISLSDPTPVERVISNRASLFDEYLLRTDMNYASAKQKPRAVRTCYRCGIEKTLIQSDGIYVCQKCGEVENIIIESEVPNHKEGTSEKIKYPYKRINHLVELASFIPFFIIIHINRL